jgi:hypothetical protein
MGDRGLKSEPWPRLEDRRVVYRAYRNAAWADRQTGQPTPAAFLRRKPPKDVKGLSVGLTKEASVRALNTIHGICELVVGDVRKVDALDVAQDSPDHSNITGVPLREDDEHAAMRIASNLARIARPTELPSS